MSCCDFSKYFCNLIAGTDLAQGEGLDLYRLLLKTKNVRMLELEAEEFVAHPKIALVGGRSWVDARVCYEITEARKQNENEGPIQRLEGSGLDSLTTSLRSWVDGSSVGKHCKGQQLHRQVVWHLD
jgi:hypothetical protein